ncbi:sporulation integral membrane protein YtvI [Virgibacillus salinus]|uniref:Sporulation integral membrane protein YtvI n=1 Tax=Virgibacillus salinus TaxID=553311 RepID=A0A1H1AWB2_9BACI|nr:sporulation integral membrane protein YtvI [Virgibacillus salinus]SDQ43960.1 sporulation integral membrane protein YtvI [Virgibacillus salinus]
MYKHKLYQLLRFSIVIFTFVAIYFILQLTVPSFYPFLLAIVLSLFMNPFVTFLEERIRIPRVIATLMVMVVAFLILIGLLIFIITELIQGTTYLAENIPTHFRTFIFIMEDLINEYLLPLYHKLTSFFHTLNPTQQETISTNLKQIINQLASLGTNFLQNILLQIPVTLTLLPGSLTLFIFTIIATFIITNDWNNLVQSFKKMIPETVHETSMNIWNHLQKAMFGFLKAQLLLISISAFIIFVGLIILKVEYALTITLIAALADILPLVGTGIIFIPWILYLFLTANYSLTISITILYMIVVVQRQLFEPKILSSNIDLNPLAALVALFAGIQIWGVSGLFIGPILLIIGNAFYQAGVFNQIGQFIKGP